MALQYYNRYESFIVNGQQTVVPYVNLLSKSTDKKHIYKHKTYRSQKRRSCVVVVWTIHKTKLVLWKAHKAYPILFNRSYYCLLTQYSVIDLSVSSTPTHSQTIQPHNWININYAVFVPPPPTSLPPYRTAPSVSIHSLLSRLQQDCLSGRWEDGTGHDPATHQNWTATSITNTCLWRIQTCHEGSGCQVSGHCN